jgi:hypothetical protein
LEQPVRTTLNLADDALLVAKQIAARERMSLGDVVSQLVRAGVGANPAVQTRALPLRGRFALLAQRDEIITPEHVRELMDREGI